MNLFRDLVLKDFNDTLTYSWTQIIDTHSKLGLPSDVLYSIPWVGRENSVISNPADPLSWDKKLTNFIEAGVKLLVSGLMAIGNFL
ncbi:MAG: hypothetical protein OEY49_20155, partial [Candidatus Heimdallarchaeota archaeon]|nr:hypothetical protein [Candidatus Heimdallarchaeota archaeon]